MLTKNRKESESIILTINDQQITIVLKEVKFGKGNILINTLDDVLILREELEELE